MKKLLIILAFIPLLGFGQQAVDGLLNVNGNIIIFNNSSLKYTQQTDTVWFENWEYVDQAFPCCGWLLLGSPTIAEIVDSTAHLEGASGTGIRRTYTNIENATFKFTVIVDSNAIGSFRLDSFGLTFNETGTRDSELFDDNIIIYATGNRDFVGDYLAIESGAPGSEIFVGTILFEQVLNPL